MSIIDLNLDLKLNLNDDIGGIDQVDSDLIKSDYFANEGFSEKVLEALFVEN